MSVSGLDPNIPILEGLAATLQPVLSDLILVGGCAVGLLVTDKSQTPVRPTIDIDLVTEAVTLSAYYALCEKLSELGYRLDEDHTFRWKRDSLIIDVMSPEEKVLGFSNRWYSEAARHCSTYVLPSGRKIRHVTAPLLIASKLDSFHGRGNGNYLHHDLEDIITLIDGRAELFDEIAQSPQEMRDYIQLEFDDLLSDSDFLDSLPGLLRPLDQMRLPQVISRLRTIAGI